MRVTLDSVARQKTATQNICVVVGMEERTPEVEAKKQELLDEYGKQFLHFMVTVHPYKLEGSAVTCALSPFQCRAHRRAARQVQQLQLGIA